MKLFFYVFYGLFPHLFFQYIRKKDNQTIAKDAINSILYQLRIHPALIKEKSEYLSTSKPFDDPTFEWSQYCLDKKYTSLSNKVTNDVENRILQRQASVNSDTALPLSPSYTSKLTKTTTTTLWFSKMYYFLRIDPRVRNR